MSLIDRALFHTAGIIFAPILGAVTTPFFLVALSCKGITALYYKAMLYKEAPKDLNNLTQRDIKWLKIKEESLRNLKDLEDTYWHAKMICPLVIPIFGYIHLWALDIKMFLYPNWHPPEEVRKDYRTEINWCQKQITLLEK